MSEFKKGERVVVRGSYGNRYGGEHGKIIGEEPGGIFSSKKLKVKLDNSVGEENFSEGDLNHEELSQGDVVDEVNKIETLVKQVANELPPPMGTELPNHVRFLKEAVESDDKDRADGESRYLSSNLLDKRVDDILGDSRSDVETSLGKINWWIKTSSVASL
ncbi:MULTISPECIES: hypothetical protein [Nostocales]|uniref:Uncharacterized protein n=1 Tax=Tolypothrix bouteillei VB521301 TaxID=1479485 RepID=A0A0C1RA26_9CYAN